MLPLVLLLAQASTPALNVPTQYIELKSLAESLSAQGTAVVADAACAKDVYAIRAVATDWKELRAALEADGRLVISESQKGWTISLSQKNQSLERQALSNYLKPAIKSVKDTYGEAIRMIDDIEKLSPEEQEAKKSTLGGGTEKTAIAQKASHLAYLFYSNEVPFHDMSVPFALTQNGSPDAFNRTIHSRMPEVMNYFVRNGNRDFFQFPGLGPKSPARTAAEDEQFKRAEVWTKLCVEPLTLSTRCKVAALFPMYAPLVLPMNNHMYFDMKLPVSLAPNDLWPSSEVEIIADRSVVTPETAKEKVSLPRWMVRRSEALLRTCEETETNVVCFISAFNDPPITTDSKVSVAEVLTSPLPKPWLHFTD